MHLDPHPVKWLTFLVLWGTALEACMENGNYAAMLVGIPVFIIINRYLDKSEG